MSNYKGTVVLGFDVAWPSIYTNAKATLAAHSLIGTIWANAYWLDGNGAMSTSQLQEFEAMGFDIQAYSGYGVGDTNLTQMSLEDAESQMASAKSGMVAKGFAPTSLAPAQRRFNSDLRTIAAGYYQNVRACHNTDDLQEYPIPDLLYVDKAGIVSLNSTHTTEQVCAAVDRAISEGKLLMLLTHQVGTGDIYYVQQTVFDAMCAYIAAKRDAGLLRVAQWNDAMVGINFAAYFSVQPFEGIVTKSSIEIFYSWVADEYGAPAAVDYSLDSGGWIEAASAESAGNRSITIPGTFSLTAHTVQLRLRSSSFDPGYSEVASFTISDQTAAPYYCVDGFYYRVAAVMVKDGGNYINATSAGVAGQVIDF